MEFMLIFALGLLIILGFNFILGSIPALRYKKNMPLGYIEGILMNLNEEEKNSVLHFINTHPGNTESKSIAFLNQLFSRSLEHDGSKRAFDTMKSRLFDKSIDALLVEKHIATKELYSEHDYMLFKLKKRLLHFRILVRSQNQGRVESLKVLLNGIIQDAKTNEVYDVWLEALTLKKHFVGIRSGIREFEKIDKEIKACEFFYKAHLFANDAYYRVILNNSLLKSYSKDEYGRYLSTLIRKLKRDYSKTRSQQINYYLHLIQVMYNERRKKYNLAIKYCRQLVELINNSPVLYRKERIGFALDNLSQYKTYAGKFLDAAKTSRKAQTYYTENSYSYLASKGQEFHVYFYHGRYDKALKCLEELLGHSLSDTGKFRRAKFIYYKACVYFAQNSFKAALSLLNNTLEIEKDKSGWNISLRILNIMIFIELDKLDEASNHLETLRKLIERTSKSESVTERDLLIIKLLRQFEKDNFKFKPSNSVLSSGLKKLAEKNKSWSWEYYTPELIPFHEWLKGKQQNKDKMSLI
jgi:tetratricopeptide (TPR) repeat protein